MSTGDVCVGVNAWTNGRWNLRASEMEVAKMTLDTQEKKKCKKHRSFSLSALSEERQEEACGLKEFSVLLLCVCVCVCAFMCVRVCV